MPNQLIQRSLHLAKSLLILLKIQSESSRRSALSSQIACRHKGQREITLHVDRQRLSFNGSHPPSSLCPSRRTPVLFHPALLSWHLSTHLALLLSSVGISNLPWTLIDYSSVSLSHCISVCPCMFRSFPLLYLRSALKCRTNYLLAKAVWDPGSLYFIT